MKYLRVSSLKIVKNEISTDIYKIMLDIVNRIDDDVEVNEDNLRDILLEEAQSHLIYTEDQWTIIKNYSSPDSPRPFNECFEHFFSDLIGVCDLVEMD